MSGLTRLERLLLAGVVLVTILAGVARYVSGFPHVPAFVLAAVALAGDAWIVSFSTEQVGERFGPAVTGVLQSTLGNLPEFFVVIFALNAGHLIVAETAIIGSILVNALLVLGIVIVVGARHASDGVMRFSPRLPNDTATLLLGSTFIIVLVGLANGAHDRASHHIKTISIVSAAAILVVYLVWLTGYLRSGKRAAGSDKTATGSDKPATHSDKPATGSDKPATRSDGSAGEATSGEPAKPRIPIVPAIGLLATAGVASAFVSDWFVSALEPTINTLDISQAFAGLVIVAIAGNAVENTAGIVLAHKGDSELAISIVKNSVAQIAAFLYPLLVIVSVATATTLTFSLAPVYAGALFGTAVIVWQISGDGEANAFEGSALIAAFVILSVVAWFEA